MITTYLLYAIVGFYDVGVFLTYKSIDFARWYVSLPLSLLSWITFVVFWSILIVGEIFTIYQEWKDQMDEYAAYFRSNRDL